MTILSEKAYEKLFLIQTEELVMKVETIKEITEIISNDLKETKLTVDVSALYPNEMIYAKIRNEINQRYDLFRHPLIDKGRLPDEIMTQRNMIIAVIDHISRFIGDGLI